MDGTQPTLPEPTRSPGGADLLHDRRAFLRAAGLGGIALLALTGCGEDVTRMVAPGSPRAAITPGAVVLDFSNDFGVLNYAYALEQLEAAFYTRVVATSGFASIFSAGEQRVLRDLKNHEIAHRDIFQAALGAHAIGALTVDFSSVTFTSRTSVLTTARTFEDVGVGAYNGAAHYLRNATYLTVAGKIVSVEARHASAIRDLLDPRSGAFAPAAFDDALAPTAVLSAADPFITTTVTVVNS